MNSLSNTSCSPPRTSTFWTSTRSVTPMISHGVPRAMTRPRNCLLLTWNPAARSMSTSHRTTATWTRNTRPNWWNSRTSHPRRRKWHRNPSGKPTITRDSEVPSCWRGCFATSLSLPLSWVPRAWMSSAAMIRKRRRTSGQQSIWRLFCGV